jgi:hypothetical protein
MSMKKKRHLKKAVKTAFTVIFCILIALMFVYVFIGAILQESYKLDPPTAAEVEELKHSVYFLLARGW